MFQAHLSSVTTVLGVTRPLLPAIFVKDFKSVVLNMQNIDLTVAKALVASTDSSYITIALLVRKREHSSTIAMSSKKRRPNIPPKPITAVLKNKNLLNVTKLADLLHLSLDVVAA